LKFQKKNNLPKWYISFCMDIFITSCIRIIFYLLLSSITWLNIPHLYTWIKENVSSF